MPKRHLRSDSVLFSIGDVKFCEQGQIQYDRAIQLPTYKFVIERFYTIKKSLSRSDAGRKIFDKVVTQVSSELESTWIFCNVYPLCLKWIRQKVSQYIKLFDALKRTPHSRLNSKSYLQKVDKLRIELQNGFDIKTNNDQRIRQLSKDMDVKMGKDEDDLYDDNCIPNKENGVCPRKRASGDTDTVWHRAAMRRYERSRRLNTVLEEENPLISNEKTTIASDSEPDSEEEFVPVTPKDKSKFLTPPPQTRSKGSSDSDSFVFESGAQKYPTFVCRDGFRKMNPVLMVVLGGLVSRFGVSENKVSECFQFVLNTVCSQNLKLPGDDVVKMESEIQDLDEEKQEKVPRKFGDLSFTLPGVNTIHRYIEDQAILSLWHVADEIKASRQRDATVTLGWDDTKKKAGHHLHDIKAGHVTIIESDKKRSTFSAGLYENISHSGKDSSETIDMVMGSMAALTDVSKSELYSFVDFWINDRAGDNIVMLDELGIESEKRLFCNAHVLLTIDEAMDTAFKQTEVKAGKTKLISTDASHVFSTPQSSVFYLGLIALCKLLSDSHCTESVSLYKDYKRFLKEQKESTAGEEVCKALEDNFLGFQSNRFGRISHLSTIILKHKDLLQKFFDENVDENANKLVLACNAFLNSRWFFLCCEVSSKFGECLVIPILQALGIDKYKDVKSEYRSWSGIKRLFEEKLRMLQFMGTSNKCNSAFEVLKKKCALLMYSNIKRQLEYGYFFNETTCSKTEILAPMTNDGCESELASCGESIKKVGSTVSLKTLSDRHLIARNRLFVSEKWKSLGLTEKRQYLNWARNSREAKLVREKGREYLKKVKAAQNIQLEMKAQKKKRKIKRSIDLLQIIKREGGPVTADDLTRLNEMNTKQLLDQIAYLRCTIAPNIRQKVKNKETGKFIILTDDELRRQITDVVKPVDEIVMDVDNLVLTALTNDQDDPALLETNQSTSECPVGQMAVWNGMLRFYNYFN